MKASFNLCTVYKLSSIVIILAKKLSSDPRAETSIYRLFQFIHFGLSKYAFLQLTPEMNF